MPFTRSRRSFAALAACAGIAVAGVALGSLTSGLPVSAAAAASATSFAGASAPTPVGAPTSLAGPLGTIVDDAHDALSDARSARVVATTLTADLAAAGLDLGIDTAIDTSAVDEAGDRLERSTFVPVLMLPPLIEDAREAADAVTARTTVVRTALDAALVEQAAQQAAAEAQRQAEEAAAAAAAAAAEAQAQANTVAGAQASAARMAADTYGWGAGEFSCLVSLWSKESGWDYQAYNDGSGATGIPQSLPGSKMASAGADWQTNATTQIAWGLDYIDRAYGSPCSAWGHSQATSWY